MTRQRVLRSAGVGVAPCIFLTLLFAGWRRIRTRPERCWSKSTRSGLAGVLHLICPFVIQFEGEAALSGRLKSALAGLLREKEEVSLLTYLVAITTFP